MWSHLSVVDHALTTRGREKTPPERRCSKLQGHGAPPSTAFVSMGYTPVHSPTFVSEFVVRGIGSVWNESAIPVQWNVFYGDKRIVFRCSD